MARERQGVPTQPHERTTLDAWVVMKPKLKPSQHATISTSNKSSVFYCFINRLLCFMQPNSMLAPSAPSTNTAPPRCTDLLA